MNKPTTNQDKNNNPTGKGGFADNPQNRSDGSWKKEDTPRYKIEKMMTMTESELSAIVKDKDASYFERTIAVAISEKQWKTIREMIHEVYGTPKQSVDLTSGGEKIKTVVEIIDARSQSTDSD